MASSATKAKAVKVPFGFSSLMESLRGLEFLMVPYGSLWFLMVALGEFSLGDDV